MGGEARRPAFFEALFKKRRAALPIDFGFFLLDSGKQGRKAQQRRSGAEPAERSKATLVTPRALTWHSKMGRPDAGRFCPGGGSDRPGPRQSGRPERGGKGTENAPALAACPRARSRIVASGTKKGRI